MCVCVVDCLCVECVLDNSSELMNLFKTSDDDGVRRQARGTLEVLGVALETRPVSVTRLTNFTSSRHPAAVSPAQGL